MYQVVVTGTNIGQTVRRSIVGWSAITPTAIKFTSAGRFFRVPGSAVHVHGGCCEPDEVEKIVSETNVCAGIHWSLGLSLANPTIGKAQLPSEPPQ